MVVHGGLVPELLHGVQEVLVRLGQVEPLGGVRGNRRGVRRNRALDLDGPVAPRRGSVLTRRSPRPHHRPPASRQVLGRRPPVEVVPAHARVLVGPCAEEDQHEQEEGAAELVVVKVFVRELLIAVDGGGGGGGGGGGHLGVRPQRRHQDGVFVVTGESRSAGQTRPGSRGGRVNGWSQSPAAL